MSSAQLVEHALEWVAALLRIDHRTVSRAGRDGPVATTENPAVVAGWAALLGQDGRTVDSGN